jgi:hypothetical protein
MPEKLWVFVASSSEQLGVVKEIAATINKSRHLHARPWQEKVFEFSKTYIESLERELDRADFAIAVLTGDDASNVRGKQVNLPRDNVIFELGLFTGRLGRERCFFFVDADSDTTIASDLSGVQAVTFRQPAVGSADGRTALKTQIDKVAAQMRALGPRSKVSTAVRDEREKLWRFSAGFAGHWWERIRQGEDDKSALSYLTVTVDELTNTPRITAKVFGLLGEPLADWYTVSTGVVLTAKPRVHYRWEGEHRDAHGQAYGGYGVIDLADERATIGEGYFFDTNFAQVAQGGRARFKHFRMYRCEPEEVLVMQNPATAEAQALIRAKLAELNG